MQRTFAYSRYVLISYLFSHVFWNKRKCFAVELERRRTAPGVNVIEAEKEGKINFHVKNIGELNLWPVKKSEEKKGIKSNRTAIWRHSWKMSNLWMETKREKA